MRLKFITYFTIAIASIFSCNIGNDKNLAENKSSSKKITTVKGLCMEINTIRPNTTANIGEEYAFEYFITEFSRNIEIQLNNIIYTIGVINETDTVVLERKNGIFNIYTFGWRFSIILLMDNNINFNRNFYKEINNSVNLISSYLIPDKIIRNFYFHKLDNKRLLTKLQIGKIKKNEKESFFNFMDRFATDIDFIVERTLEEAQYVTSDENLSNIIELAMDPIRDLSQDEYFINKLYRQF